MVYEPKYVDLEDVERETGLSFSNNTKPNIDEVSDYIEELEGEVDAKRLGWGDDRNEGEGYIATDTYLNVPAFVPRLTPLRRFELRAQYGIDPLFGHKGVLVNVPDLYKPIISMTSLSINTKDLSQEPIWTALTEGYKSGWTETSGTDYLCVKEKGKAGQEHIFKWVFYSTSRPEPGHARIKATFAYGWALPIRILRRWCISKVAIWVLNRVAESGEPSRLSTFVGGNFQEFVNTDLAVQIDTWEREMLSIEKRYFPDDISVGVLLI